MPTALATAPCESFRAWRVIASRCPRSMSCAVICVSPLCWSAGYAVWWAESSAVADFLPILLLFYFYFLKWFLLLCKISSIKYKACFDSAVFCLREAGVLKGADHIFIPVLL